MLIIDWRILMKMRAMVLMLVAGLWATDLRALIVGGLRAIT